MPAKPQLCPSIPDSTDERGCLALVLDRVYPVSLNVEVVEVTMSCGR